MLLKQATLYLILSILLILFTRYVHLLIVYIDLFFVYINLQLAPFFNTTFWGVMLRKIVILVSLPLILAGIPALIYRAIKGRTMPYLIPTVWVIWTVIVLNDILIRQR